MIALEAAGPRARGATLYCTLEPCSHTGRTGPCAPLVVRPASAGGHRARGSQSAGDGRGLRHLREHGIDVTLGVEQAAAARQNAVFLTTIRAAART